MSELQLRPRFKFKAEADPDELLNHLRQTIKQESHVFLATNHKNQVLLRFRPHLHHLWSPQLSIEIEANESGKGSLIRGLFAPNPSVWTFFVFLYSGFAVGGTFALMLGLTQVTLNKTPWGLWVAGALGCLLLLVYIAGQIGKNMGKPQMNQLRGFLIWAIGEHLQPLQTE